MVTLLAPVLPRPSIIARPEVAPRLRLIEGGGSFGHGFQRPEREKVALRAFVHNGERELRGVAVRLDENAVEIFGVNRGLDIGDPVVIRLELVRGERPVWLPACPHLVSPERSVLWFDRPDPNDVDRVRTLVEDVRTGRARRDGLYAYFHAPASTLKLDRVALAPPN